MVLTQVVKPCRSEHRADAIPEIEKRDIKEDTVIEQNGHNQSINGRDGRDDD